MTGLETPAQSAYRFHVGELGRLIERVNALCAIVNSRPDAEEILSNAPIVEGELSGNYTVESYQRLEAYFTEALEKYEVGR